MQCDQIMVVAPMMPQVKLCLGIPPMVTGILNRLGGASDSHMCDRVDQLPLFP